MENANVLKDLCPGMLVALASNTEREITTCPHIGKVLAVSTEVDRILDYTFSFQWLQAERTTHKSRWLKYYHQSDKVGIAKYSEVLLYDFKLTDKGLICKNTRDYLRPLYENDIA